jgi:uncharacterized protein YggE
LFLVSVMVVPAGAQLRDAQRAVPEITATGRGDVLISPDRAVLLVNVETHASSAVRAASDNAAATTQTIAAVRAAGATPEQIKTSGYSVWMDYDSNRGRPKGFGARNTLRVEVTRIADLGKLIDASLSGGATQLQPIQFLGPEMDKARRDAIAAAVAKARGDAEALAAAAGGTLGELITLSGGNLSSPSGQWQLESVVVTGTSVPTNLNVSDLVVSATAVGRWRFVSRGHQ